MNFIPYGRQQVDQDDIDAVIEVLKSDWLTQGPGVEKFERAVADHCGAKYGVAVSSGTAALHIASLAAGLSSGDILWTSPNSFVASANAGLYCGAEVDFVDIEIDSGNMSVEKLEEKLLTAEKIGKLPKVLIPVHFAGKPCDMDRIAALSKKYGFIVIEDASHAIGASIKDDRVGSSLYSDMTIFSFHPVKVVTTGEGGMVVTNNKAHYENLIKLRSHGITKNPAEMDNESEGGWYYQQIQLGLNYRLSDMHAALGLSQMAKLDSFVAKRNELAGRYDKLLAGLPLKPLKRDEGLYSAFHLYVVLLDVGLDRRKLFDSLRAKNIGVMVHYIPIHLQPWYAKLGFKPGDFPASESYYKRALTIPLYPSMSEDEQDYVVKSLKEDLG